MSLSVFTKRSFDLCFSIVIVFVFSPIYLIVYLLVRRKMGIPVIFCQRRPGLYGKPFVMFKFRTMKEAVDSNGQPLPDEQRLTRLGKFLRSSSLDELPELWNVIKGEMSLVGPRPLLMEYLERYTPEQNRRHEVRPGITGWAQINGRNAISWEEKFALDVWYVDNWTLWLDIKVLWMTLAKVLTRADIQAEGCATMPVFIGTQPIEEENL